MQKQYLKSLSFSSTLVFRDICRIIIHAEVGIMRIFVSQLDRHLNDKWFYLQTFLLLLYKTFFLLATALNYVI